MKNKNMKTFEEHTSELNVSDGMSSFTFDDLKKAFIDGQNSVTAEIGYEKYGDMDEYAERVINKNFDKWFEENYSQRLRLCAVAELKQKTSNNSKSHNWLYTLLCTVFSLESFGRHLVGNRFPSILRYWRPRNLVLKPNKPIYKWLWWYFVPKHGG